MKRVKQVLSLCVSFCMILACAVIPTYADNSDLSSELTLEQIEQEILEVLEEEYPNIEYGTIEYFNFLSDQHYADTVDAAIKQSPNYWDIMYYVSLYRSLASDVLVSSDDIFVMPESHLSETVANLKSASQETADAAQAQIEAVLNENPPLAVNATYNASAAVSYARRWAQSRNMAYTSQINDCTNFVSQCVEAGGIPMEFQSNYQSLFGSVNETTNYWYSWVQYDLYATLSKVTTSFIRVEDFYTYMTRNGYCSTVIGSNLDNLSNWISVGDVVELGNDGVYEHAIIITGYSNGEYTWCGHTTDRLDEDLSYLEGFNCYRVMRF